MRIFLVHGHEAVENVGLPGKRNRNERIDYLNFLLVFIIEKLTIRLPFP